MADFITRKIDVLMCCADSGMPTTRCSSQRGCMSLHEAAHVQGISMGQAISGYL